MSAAPSSSDMKKRYPEVFQYIQSVRDAFPGDDEFNDFLRSMHLFKHNMISFDFLSARIETMFKYHPHLIHGFNAFIPGGGHRTTAVVDVRKNLRFVQSVKDRFAHDPRVFDLFLGIMRRCRRTEGMSVHEARREVKELIKDHPDLLEQFDRVVHGKRVSTGYPPQQWYNKLCVLPGDRVAENLPDGYGDKREKTCNLDLPADHNFRDDTPQLEDNKKGGQSEKDEKLTRESREHVNQIKRENKRSRKSEDLVSMQLHQGSKNGEIFKLDDISKSYCSNKNNYKGLNTQEDRECYSVKRQRQGDSEKETGKEKKRLDGSCSSVLKHTFSRMTERVDYSKCQRENPSYCFRPANSSTLLASGTLPGDASVLNDVLVSVPRREYTCFKERNQYEETLFKCEDDRFEMDVLLESVKSTAGRVEDFLNKIEDKSIEPNEIEVVKHFKSSNLRCIEVLYGEHGLSVIDILHKNASLVLPVILTRLKQKIEELSRAYSTFDKVWTEIFSDNYHRSLEHDGLSSKQMDTNNSSEKGSDVKSEDATLAGLHARIEDQKDNDNASMGCETNEPSS